MSWELEGPGPIAVSQLKGGWLDGAVAGHSQRGTMERVTMDSEVVTRLDRIESLLAALLERETIKDYYSTDELRVWSARRSSPCASGRGSAGSTRRSGNPAEALSRRG